jgi:hypothetical protein
LANDLGKQMRVPRRETVFVVGSIPAAEFAARGLTLKSADKNIDSTSHAVALIYVAGDLLVDAERVKLTQWLRRGAVEAAWRGALCVIACMRGQKSNAQNVAKNRGSIGDRVQFGYQDRPAEIAELCARYNGGMPANTALIITLIGDVLLPAEATCLLRRAFFDFERITLTSLSGGRSGMGVWRVEAESSDKDLRSPFVVKCGKASEIDEQVNTYRDVVEDRVPYRGCGPLCLERSVRGVDLRLSVSRFVEHATRLDEYILDRDAGEIIHSIYNRVLRRWRAEPSFQKVQLFPELLWRTTWPKYLEKLGQVFPHANQAVSENLLSPQEIFDVLSGGLAVEVPYCRAHDDLNLRNVFVSEARSEAILIDFTRSQKRPLSKDCARLDVGLGFDDELNAKQPLPLDVLFDFYTGDLFSISLVQRLKGDVANKRLTAIAAIRTSLLAEATNANYDIAEEYKIAVAAELLYHARRNTNWGHIAYRCVSFIVDQMRVPGALTGV